MPTPKFNHILNLINQNDAIKKAAVLGEEKGWSLDHGHKKNVLTRSKQPDIPVFEGAFDLSRYKYTLTSIEKDREL